MAADHDLDLGPAIREALLDEALIAGELAVYADSRAVFTRRPVPEDAGYPMVLINPPAALTDEDGLTSDRPVWMGDVLVYGLKGAPGTAEDQTRTVEQLGFRVRNLFHRQRWALQVGGFHVIDVRASGPVPAPVDDDKEIGRAISLIVRLRRGN